MKYFVLYSKQSEKYLSRLTKSKTITILNRIEFIASNPSKPDNNIRKLIGTSSSYRLRIGNFRVIYHLDAGNKTIFITKIAPRGSAYA